MLPLGVTAVIGISVVVLIIILVIIDVSCYFVNSCGITMIICTRLCGKSPALSKEKTAEEGERYDSRHLSATTMVVYPTGHVAVTGGGSTSKEPPKVSVSSVT